VLELLEQGGKPFAQDCMVIDDKQFHAGIISRIFSSRQACAGDVLGRKTGLATVCARSKRWCLMPDSFYSRAAMFAPGRGKVGSFGDENSRVSAAFE
jgi:hypothetical protein